MSSMKLRSKQGPGEKAKIEDELENPKVVWNLQKETNGGYSFNSVKKEQEKPQSMQVQMSNLQSTVTLRKSEG